MGSAELQRVRRRRLLLTALAVVAALGMVAAILLRTRSPIGHWDGKDGHDSYQRAYDRAFAAMPTAQRRIDVRTEFGIVRVYRFKGTGHSVHPIVLLPGRASAAPVWADNMPSLLEIGDVYAVDLLGEPGMSVQARPIADDADQAAWLHQTLEALPETRFNLVGLSIGGWTAANLALRQPDRIATLTLIDPAMVFADMPLETIVRSLPSSVPWLPRSWRDGFNSYTAGGAPVDDVPVADMIEAGMQHYVMRLPAPARIADESLQTLTLPVLAIIAGNSVMHDARAAASTAKGVLRNGTVEVYEGASHAVNGEQPDRIAADIARFITAARS